MARDRDSRDRDRADGLEDRVVKIRRCAAVVKGGRRFSFNALVAVGVGSGHGKTATRGHKGQWASAGAKKPTDVFEGGQMQLFRRIPKRGFSHATWDRTYHVVNVGDLDAAFDDGASVDPEALKKVGLAK